MKKTLLAVMCVLLVLLAVSCGSVVLKAHVLCSEWVVVSETPSTCKVLGKTVYKCKDCGAIREEVATEFADHTPDEDFIVQVIPVTCNTDGGKLNRCSVCGDTYVEVTAKKKTGDYKHVYKKDTLASWATNNVGYLDDDADDGTGGHQHYDHIKLAYVENEEKTEFSLGTLKATCPGCGDELYYDAGSWKTVAGGAEVDKLNWSDSWVATYLKDTDYVKFTTLDGLWTWATDVEESTMQEGSNVQCYFFFSGDNATTKSNDAVRVQVVEVVYTKTGKIVTTSCEFTYDNNGSGVTCATDGDGKRSFSFTPNAGSVLKNKKLTFKQDANGDIVLLYDSVSIPLRRVLMEDGNNYGTELSNYWLSPVKIEGSASSIVKVDSTYHYVGNVLCGLENVKEKHNAELNGSCSVCLYNSENVYSVKVTLSDTDTKGSSAIDSYFIEKGSSILLPFWKEGDDTTYYEVFGSNAKYKAEKYSVLYGTTSYDKDGVVQPTSDVVIYLKQVQVD